MVKGVIAASAGPRYFRLDQWRRIEVIESIQEDRNLVNILDQLTGEPKGSSVIHGDVPGDDFLLLATALAQRERWLKIIDFEFITLGDPAVDLGWMFADYLSEWILSLH